MVVGMVADGMTLRDHALDQLRILLDIVADEEKRGRNVVLLQGIEDLLRAAVFIARIKGQVDDLFRRIAQKRRVILLQLFASRVAGGRLTLLPEAQSPRAGRDRRPIPCARHDRQRRQHRQHQQKRQISP